MTFSPGYLVRDLRWRYLAWRTNKAIRAMQCEIEEETRSRRGSGSAQPGQPILLPGSEETARGLASASSAPSHPAGTPATPRLCARRASTSAGAGRLPHAPAPAGLQGGPACPTKSGSTSAPTAAATTATTANADSPTARRGASHVLPTTAHGW